jgi:hypothetical protein
MCRRLGTADSQPDRRSYCILVERNANIIGDCRESYCEPNDDNDLLTYGK